MDKNKKLFPQRLWELIHDGKYSFCLRWSQDGQRVYLNRNEFETHYLKTPSNQFHTQKAISFVRQMNMYGFRKVDDCFYENDNFKRNCPHLLKNMIRKHSNRTYFSSPPSSLGRSSTHLQPPYAAHAAPQQQVPAPALPLPVFAHQPAGSGLSTVDELTEAVAPQASQQQQQQQHQQASKQQIQLSQTELRRIHQHLHNQQQHLTQDSTLVTTLRRQRHQNSTPPETGSPPEQSCPGAAEVARSISNLGAVMAAHTPLASSLYYRLAADLNFNSNNQQPGASGQQAPSAAEQQLISQLMQSRNSQLAAATNNPNSLLARPTNTCLEQQSHLNQSHQLLQHSHQQQQQQTQLANRQMLSQPANNNQLNFLDSTSGTIGSGSGLSAAEQMALQENLVRTFLQLHSRQQLHQQSTATTHNNNNQLPTNQLQNKPFLVRTLHEQNLLQCLATLTSGDPRPPSQTNSPLELVVKKR